MKVKKRGLWAAVSCAAAVLLFSVMILVSVAAGENATAADPLVSVSYLDKVFKGEIMTQLQKIVESEVAAMDAAMSQRISAVGNALKTPSAAANTHTEVTVPAGSSYSIAAGGEILVVSGSAGVKEAGLTDVTAGASVSAGGVLAENHLYVASARVNLTAETAVKLLVRK